MTNKFSYKISWVFLLLFAIVFSEGCATKRKKKETSKLSKFYHNVTSEYNGYFNANELMEYAMLDLQAAHVDNYTQIIELYDFVSVPDPKMVNADMDKAIEKVTRVATLHEPGDWVDDCYVLMGRAQYVKQDYATAVETFEYFQEDFNPANPYGRNYLKNKISKRASNKARKKARKEKQKEKERARKEKEKLRKEEKKRKEKERKERKKNRKKSTRGKKKRREKKVVDTTTVVKPIVQEPQKVTASKIEKNDTPTKPKVKEPKDKTAYNEGLVWLAKSYIRAGKYNSAEFLLNRLEDKKGLDSKLIKEIKVAQADLMIKSGRAYNALDFIDEAIAHKKTKRKEKARYAFVAGQILIENGQYSDAEEYFNISRKKSRDYKMKFMATLNAIKCSQMKGGDTDVTKKLKRMLKETKYAEFKDEIYFAMGELEIEKGNIDKAKEYFAESIKFSGSNPSLKAEAYYQVASISFNMEDYVTAKYYYDSTLTVMDKVDPRRKEVKKYAENLTEISKNIQTITQLDSVIAMASLSKEELSKIAKKRLEEEKTSGTKKGSVVDKNLFVKQRRRSGTSDFWPYNIVKKEQGISQFRKQWGERPLVDNWRLESKIDAAELNAAEAEESEEEEVVASDDISEEDYNRIMADIPTTPLAKGKIEEQIRKAMFALGKQYRDKIQKYKKSAETLEELNRRYQSHTDIVDAYYYLYLDYRDLNNSAMSDKYKDLIVTQFPDTKYGQLIANPEYALSLEEEKKRLDRYYDNTFKMFQKGEYVEVLKRVDKATKSFGKENKLVAKFSLLKAMCLGHTKGKEDYIKGLKEVIVRYPDTPEELKAKEIMRFLKGDKSAFGTTDIAGVDEMFELKDDSRHYVAVILFDYSDKVLQPAKIAISDYNKHYHSKDRLQMSEMLLNKTENTQLILIRSFSNREKAMTYYNGVQKSLSEYIPEDLVNFELLPITQHNYRRMLQQRTHTNYRAYFGKHYLQED